MLKKTTFGGMTLALLAGLFGPQSWGQATDPTFPVNGTQDKHLVATVLEHATVHVDHKTVVEDGTVHAEDAEEKPPATGETPPPSESEHAPPSPKSTRSFLAGCSSGSRCCTG